MASTFTDATSWDIVGFQVLCLSCEGCRLDSMVIAAALQGIGIAKGLFSFEQEEYILRGIGSRLGVSEVGGDSGP